MLQFSVHVAVAAAEKYNEQLRLLGSPLGFGIKSPDVRPEAVCSNSALCICLANYCFAIELA